MLGLAINIYFPKLEQILRELRCRDEAARFNFSVAVSNKQKDHAMPLEISLTTEQQVKVSVAPVTPKGKPVALDGAVLFSTNDNVTINMLDDKSAMILAPEVIGDVTVTVSGDADLGAGVVTIKDTILLHISDPQASSLGLTAGTPETKP